MTDCKNAILKVGAELPDELWRQMAEFEALCLRLGDLVDQENDAFMLAAFAPKAERSMKKISLLDIFEEQSEVLGRLLALEGAQEVDLQNRFVELIQEMQFRLRINTSWHIHMMAQRVEKVAQSASQGSKTRLKRGELKADEICH